MRQTKTDTTALAKTIDATGFPYEPKSSWIVAFSAPTREDNERIHTKTNQQLLEAVRKNSVGTCIHISGEMRALADRFHRRVCAELAKHTKTRFVVVYDIPEEYSKSPDGVGKWNAQRWASKTWSDKLSAFDLIGNAFVDVRSYSTLGEIQFSVFGNKYVQLQEKHPDENN